MDSTHDQRPNLSCDECRRRKSKCDRVRPQCGGCAASKSRCVFPGDSQKRGPKKGQLQVLRARIETLEKQLAAKDMTWHADFDFDDMTTEDIDRFSQYKQPSVDAFEPKSIETQPNVNAFEHESMETLTFGTAPSLPWPENGSIPLDPGLSVESHSSCISSMLPGLPLSALVDADLEQLFFDRVYPSAPIIHKERYITMMNQEDPHPTSICLRLAIRTSATAFSARYHDVGERLYLEALQSLENLESSDEHTLPWGVKKEFHIEHIQAWLLLAIYEYMHKDKIQASFAMSTALRLIQRCRLGDLDAANGILATQHGSPETCASTAKESFAILEEKRRTFWLAFCFDRLLNTWSNVNWAFPEEMIRLRVPAPEANFQHSQQTKTPLLSEVLTAGNNFDSLSPFAECVTLMALYDRCVTHRRLVLTAVCDGGRESSRFWMRHNWLMDATADRRRRLLLQTTDSTPNILEDDPMVAFTHFFASSLNFHLVDTAGLWPWRTVEQEEPCVIYEQQACLVASEQIRVAETLLRFSGFKVSSRPAVS
ncbi:fungal specific transcription factor domain protein [Pyrenophora tritici-repentis]|nr:Fungal specific transcription factor domain containing protein [Pyrenophora tritici-repentis]KAI2480000.1 fungal specific transcription factor domain protein [Pyrenophora tritici-repentis]